MGKKLYISFINDTNLELSLSLEDKKCINDVSGLGDGIVGAKRRNAFTPPSWLKILYIEAKATAFTKCINSDSQLNIRIIGYGVDYWAEREVDYNKVRDIGTIICEQKVGKSWTIKSKLIDGYWIEITNARSSDAKSVYVNLKSHGDDPWQDRFSNQSNSLVDSNTLVE